MEVQIHCAYTEVIDPALLTPNPRNPNHHPKKQIELLAKIIQSQGWRAPVTVSNRSGFVVRGHGRLQAALLLTLRERRMLVYLNELQAKPMIANVYDELTGEASEVEVTQEQRTLIDKVEKRQPLIDRILMVEEALTRVQERKIRALETKHRMLLKWQKQTQAAPPDQSS